MQLTRVWNNSYVTTYLQIQAEILQISLTSQSADTNLSSQHFNNNNNADDNNKSNNKKQTIY